MEVERTLETLGWYAVHSHPKQEERASANLRAWNVETFSPKIKKGRTNPYTHVRTFERKPLFPRYIFARFDVNNALRKVLFTRGVRSVVSFGCVPARINDGIIALIQSRVAEDGLIEYKEHLTTGDRVLIESGPLTNLLGIFEREVKGSDRVLILLAAVSYQASAVMERQDLRKVNSPAAWQPSP
jgi:transcriptional antiterminator RfaH